jgi:hypothetical protein
MATTALPNLKDQLLNQWSALNITELPGGISLADRATALADTMKQSGINSLADLKLGSKNISVDEEGGTAPVGFLTNNGQQLGFLGNVGDFENKADYLQPNNLVSWSGQGHGNVGYSAVQTADGGIAIVPQWNSSSDAAQIRNAAKMIAAMYGGASLMSGAGTASALDAGMGVYDTSNLASSVGGASALDAGMNAYPSTGNIGSSLPAGLATDGLTASQIANLVQGGVGLLSTAGVVNALSPSQRTPTGVSIPTQGVPLNTADYYNAIQQNYNKLLPAMPRDVASPLQQWYSDGVTPETSVTGSLFSDMTGGVKTLPPVVKPTTLTTQNAPLYSSLTKTSTPTDVSNAYADFIKANGGNTAANRTAAVNYLTNLGLTQDQINSSYNTYLSTLPASGNTYDLLNAKATPSNISQAYSAFVSGSGGDTAQNQQTAINYLQDIGLSDEQINQAYNTYLSTTNTAQLPVAETQNYTSLSSQSSPENIAAAYRDFVASSGGDTAANQQAAIDYLTNLGISQNTIGTAYGLFKGA